MKSDTSARLFDEARAVIPGGGDSPVRALRRVVAPHPLFVARGVRTAPSQFDAVQVSLALTDADVEAVAGAAAAMTHVSRGGAA